MQNLNRDAQRRGAIDGLTRVIVHLAFPSTHLRTPAFFNPRVVERGLNAVLVPWQVSPEALPTVWDGLRCSESVAGVIVTIPHKIAVAGLCDRLEGDSESLGVTNAARREADGSFTGRMFDGEAYLAGLRGQGHEIRGCRALLVGAGGAGTAIACSLARAGVARLTIANRDRGKAVALAAQLRSLWPDLDVAAGEADPQGHDLIINATSLGLKPGDPLPLDPARVPAGALVAEVVMNPAVTPLLAACADRGVAIHKGEYMITAQIDMLIDFLIPDPTEQFPR